MSARFNASILFGHQTLLSNVMGRVQASGGTVLALTEAEFRGMSDLAGALNYWAAQAAPAPPVPPPVGAEVVVLDVVVEPDKRVLFTASASYVTAIPFDVPAGPYHITPMFSGTAAEYAWGGMAFAHAALSRTPGDLTGASGGMSSIEVWRNAEVDGPGRWFYNIQLIEGSQDRGSGFSWRAPR